jgi:deoxyribonuclease V
MNSFIWPENISEAKAAQMSLEGRVTIVPYIKKPIFVAGVDASFMGDKVIGVACLFKYPELIPIEDAYAVMKVSFPYIPGFLSFREGPAIIEALNRLKTKPDLILFDGQGIAHPKRLGIASHIGILIDVPTIGCAKSRLIGKYKEPKFRKGEWAQLKHKGEIVGAVLRTRDYIKPVFVSPGHRIDLKTSIKIVLACTGKFRIPEPVRRADSISKRIKKEKLD